MVSFQRHLLCGLCVVLMIGIIPFQAIAQQATTTAIEPRGDGLTSAEVLADLEGFTSAGDSSNFCFNATPDGTFNAGESVKFNVFWSDTAEEDLQNNYLVRVDVKSSDGASIILLRKMARYDLAGQLPGAEFNFCFAITTTIPADAPQGTFPWSARVRKLADLTKIQGEVDDITIIPAVKQ
jgi:hypothetical protein